MNYKYRLVNRHIHDNLQHENQLLKNEIALATDFIKTLGSQETEIELDEKHDENNSLIRELKSLQTKLKEVAKEEKQRTNFA